MRDLLFRFKKFSVQHEKSSMKVGVDAVLLGAWADIGDARRILEVGTGCGVISLMCAQRNPVSEILSIDIDGNSVEEASLNFVNSVWSERLETEQKDFLSMEAATVGKFDYIISNPPYFDSGIETPNTARLIARHQSLLSPYSLLRHGVSLLNSGGRIGMIVPVSEREKVIEVADETGVKLVRETLVIGRKNKSGKRVLLEFVSGISETNDNSRSDGASKKDGKISFSADQTVMEYRHDQLTIKDERDDYTEEYRMLTRDFYIIF